MYLFIETKSYQTSHFSSGILLAPVTTRLMAQIITGLQPELDISVFSSARFPH